MTTRRRATTTADIVNMSSYVQELESTRPRRHAARLPRQEMGRGSQADATLLSMRQHLGLHASVEIDDLAGIAAHYSSRVRDRVVADIRGLLDHEFGSLRVYRHRRAFIVQHSAPEGLIAGLLRIQFHARQIELPSVNFLGDEIEKPGVGLTWGVGHSLIEAESERLRRRRSKRQPRRDA